MTCNIYIIKGSVKFVFFDNSFEICEEVIINERKKYFSN